MAVILPFRAVRPKAEFAAKVAELPYDVMNAEEAFEISKDNPLSFLRVDKPEITMPKGTDVYSGAVYARAGENFDALVEKGVFEKDNEESFYLYRLTVDGKSQTGVVCCVLAEDYVRGEIKKHELTRADKEADRIRHVEALGAHTGPIFLAYRAQPTIDAFAESYTGRVAPVYDFTADDGVSHTVWVVEGEDGDALKAVFAPVTALYIADGHHRAAAAVSVAGKNKQNEEAGRFLAVCFPHNQLRIMDYNRVVKTLNGLAPSEFLGRVKETFEVTEIGGECYKPEKRHEFGMYTDGKWYKLTAKNTDEGDPIASLDVSVLQSRLLAPVLGIEDPRVSKEIDFIGGIRGLSELQSRVDSGDWAVAFALYPTSLEELFDAADADKIMPPKSTWFEPKLRSGLFVHRY